MRRLPIFLLLDVSESMIGTQITLLEEGVSKIINSLRKDPSALETVYISIIAFAGKAKVIVPLTDIVSFYPPRLPIGGGTSLGMALDVLMREINKQVVKQTTTEKGDWKPIVFLFTDGVPTDNPGKAIEQWNKEYSSFTTMVAVALGDSADTSVLKKITNDVLLYDGNSEEDFYKFIEWVSNSIKTQSKKLDSNQDNSGIDLTKTTDNLMIVEDNEFSIVEPTSVIFTGRCSNKRLPYLVKYSKRKTLKSLEKYFNQNPYNLEGCFPISEDYFNWSSEHNQINNIKVSSLRGTPSCPHCNNSIAFASCGFCNKIICISGEGRTICPWCNKENEFVYTNDDFNIQRGEG